VGCGIVTLETCGSAGRLQHLFEGTSSKPCKAPLRVIQVKVIRLDCVEFRALGCS
jgi:hypothetical protein